jgi:Domain of unknown function (DUF5655)/Domain of unknown function (DUF4287)
MPTVEDSIAAQLSNIEATYGRSIDEWVAVVSASGLSKHNEVVAMLKASHGLKHGAAHRLSLVARERLGQAPAAGNTSVAAGMQPIYDRLAGAVRALGDDVEEVPKKGYVSLRRRKQFAMLQAGAQWVNVGMILRDAEPGDRLEPAGTWNALFTHRVRVRSAGDVDAELLGWLRAAYDAGA